MIAEFKAPGKVKKFFRELDFESEKKRILPCEKPSFGTVVPAMHNCNYFGCPSAGNPQKHKALQAAYRKEYPGGPTFPHPPAHIINRTHGSFE